jgi:signal transduction histidine kinase
MKRSLLAISISLFAGQGFYVLYWFDRYNRSTQDAMAFESNRVEIARLDEVLTMSARVHAATGEPVWQDRYREHVDLLSAVLEETIALAGNESARTAIALVADANDRLVTIEEQAFDLVARESLAEAFALLTSADYETQKDHYQTGLEEALIISQASIRMTVDYHHSALILGVIGMFLSLLVLTELWRRLSVLEQREVAHKISAALEQERRLNALQRQFVSMVSHEFRTPLAIIDGTAQRLERQKEPLTRERVLNAIKKIRQSIGRLTGLMENVLSLAHLEEGRIEAVIEEFNLLRLINEVVANYRDIYPNRTITLALDSTPRRFAGDSKLLGQVISNLLSNALKYSDKDSPVHIEVYSETRDVAIAFHDRGRGMSPEEIESIGQRFFRASSSEGIAGSGVGLQLVKHVTELHGGGLEVSSRINFGSTFTIHLPQNVDHHDQSTPVAEDTKRSALLAS